MDRKDKEESRRHFLAAIGVDAAALLVPAALVRPAFGQVCAPPGNTFNPTPWVRDCRSIHFFGVGVAKAVFILLRERLPITVGVCKRAYY